MSQEVIVAVEAALQAGKLLRERTDDIGKISFTKSTPSYLNLSLLS